MPLYPGSFAGVPFETEGTEDRGGIRGVIHRFPGHDLPYVEQLGQADDRFTVNMHVVGDDHQARANDLIAALKTPGIKRLVHWTRGTVKVKLDPESGFTIREVNEELRKTSISAGFIRQGEITAGPTVEKATTGAVASQAAVVRTAAIDTTEENFSTSGPNFLEVSALDKLTSFTADIRRTQQRINATFGVADLSRAIDDFASATASLVRTPRTLAVEISGLINSVVNGMTAITTELRLSGSRGDAVEDFQRQRVAMGILAQLGDFGDDFDEVDETTPSRQQEAVNDRTLRDTVQAAVLADVLSASAAIPLESIDQADGILDQISARMDALLGRGLDDGLDASLRDLRAEFYAHLQAQTATLSTLSTYTPPVTWPMVIVAYRIYGDPWRDEDILRRNPSVQHPGFVTGGVPIEVLVDG